MGDGRDSRTYLSRLRALESEAKVAKRGGWAKVQPMKYWEIVADKLSAAGWSWGMMTATDAQARALFIVDAHRDDGSRFVVRSDELLTAFLELEQATRKRAA